MGCGQPGLEGDPRRRDHPAGDQQGRPGVHRSLLINAALHTPEALPSILEQLTQEGYTFVPISQLILTGNYSIDHNGRQCPC